MGGGHFVGYNEKAVGITGENPGRLILENCRFDGVDTPIEISGSNVSNDVTRVKNTRFEHYEVGSRIARRETVLFDHCTLLGTGFGPYYGVFSDHNFLFILRESEISDHNNANGTISNEDLFAGLGFGTGAKVEGGFLFWMDGGTINGCDIGIGNHDIEGNGTATNILLNHFATISNCSGGIVMNGDATKGLVVMDCARLLNNDQGILGEDIRLMIDPTVIAQQNSTPVNPNTFTLAHSSSGINRYFSICYREFPSPGQPIPAKMNYWGDVWGGVTFQNPTPLLDITLTRPMGNIACAAVVTMDVSGAVTRPPAGCDIEECPPGGGCVDDCPTVLTTGFSTTVKGRFMDGYDQVNAEQFDVAHSSFGDVAALWQPDLTDDGYDQYCQSLIHASRSLSEAGSAPNLPRSQPQRITVSGSVVRVQPNPATGTFTVMLPASSCTLRVWDAFGRMVYEQASASGSTAVDASGWAAGVYWVEVIGDNLRQQAKVVVQR